MLDWFMAVFSVLSALSWLYAAKVTVSRTQEVEYRRKKAEKRGARPNLAGVSLDGNDLSGTFRVQSKWNAIAAIFAACVAIAQALKVFV